MNAINTLNQIPKDKFETSFMANYNFTIVNLRLFEDTKDVKYEKQFKQSLLLTKQLAQNKEQIEIFNNFSLKLQKKN